MKITEIEVAGYERVARAEDAESGLLAYIAVHSTALGPAIGGTRIWKYESDEAALRDVLRLSMGMTYKSAVAETGLGGGKSVVVLRDGAKKSPELLRAMAAFVHRFEGSYFAAEDVGSTPEDLVVMREITPYVVALPVSHGGSGNPSPFTAWGVFRGIQACVSRAYGSDDLKGLHVAVQGLGSVGTFLCEHLHRAGAQLTVADVRESSAQAARERFGATVVAPDVILQMPCDVLAPCALGAVINDRTLPELRCRVVAGAANNQLDRDEHGDLLRKRGIVYAPDFVINAGGIINIAVELSPSGYQEAAALERCSRIYDVIARVLQEADDQEISTHQAAVDLAKRRVAASARTSSLKS
ncbi:MAG TPA: Glu/Leu/Phe/Val dehydrogenase dimerization domain-containing protein [Planctomycetota bacterium]|nr:Glu/Leu/Phe/Val dehydrogenase dimerization domain-containing protein [Planctomycetota bacterium]